MAYAVGVNSDISHESRRRSGAWRGPIVRPPFAVHVPAVEEPLVEIIESAILPRLMAAHGVVAQVRPRSYDDHRVGMDVAALAPLALNVEADALLDHIDALLRQGVSIDTLFVDLLAPAARYLGALWEQDRCDFIEVTMGLWRLQEVVRELAARFPPERRSGSGGNRALFAAMPGDQHSFGTVMIDETFRRHGWKTDLAPDPTTPELIERVARDWFDVVGLTVSCDCHIEPLPSLIRALRSVSRNPRIIVMVGGRVFLEDPLLAMEVGADGTAADAIQAVALALGLVARLQLPAEVSCSGV